MATAGNDGAATGARDGAAAPVPEWRGIDFVHALVAAATSSLPDRVDAQQWRAEHWDPLEQPRMRSDAAVDIAFPVRAAKRDRRRVRKRLGGDVDQLKRRLSGRWSREPSWMKRAKQLRSAVIDALCALEARPELADVCFAVARAVLQAVVQLLLLATARSTGADDAQQLLIDVLESLARALTLALAAAGGGALHAELARLDRLVLRAQAPQLRLHAPTLSAFCAYWAMDGAQEKATGVPSAGADARQARARGTHPLAVDAHRPPPAWDRLVAIERAVLLGRYRRLAAIDCVSDSAAPMLPASWRPLPPAPDAAEASTAVAALQRVAARIAERSELVRMALVPVHRAEALLPPLDRQLRAFRRYCGTLPIPRAPRASAPYVALVDGRERLAAALSRWRDAPDDATRSDEAASIMRRRDAALLASHRLAALVDAEAAAASSARAAMREVQAFLGERCFRAVLPPDCVDMRMLDHFMQRCAAPDTSSDFRRNVPSSLAIAYHAVFERPDWHELHGAWFSYIQQILLVCLVLPELDFRSTQGMLLVAFERLANQLGDAAAGVSLALAVGGIDQAFHRAIVAHLEQYQYPCIRLRQLFQAIDAAQWRDSLAFQQNARAVCRSVDQSQVAQRPEITTSLAPRDALVLAHNKMAAYANQIDLPTGQRDRVFGSLLAHLGDQALMAKERADWLEMNHHAGPARLLRNDANSIAVHVAAVRQAVDYLCQSGPLPTTPLPEGHPDPVTGNIRYIVQYMPDLFKLSAALRERLLAPSPAQGRPHTQPLPAVHHGDAHHWQSARAGQPLFEYSRQYLRPA